MFLLKKYLSMFLMPLPSMLLLGLVGLFLLWFSRRVILGRICVTVSIIGICLMSFQPISSSILRPLERQYLAYSPQTKDIEYIMVLGSGHVVDKQIPSTSQLSRTAVMRLAEGIRIFRMHPNAKLIFSGYDGNTNTSHARMMAKVALELGVPKTSILLLETPKDTKEEAMQAATAIGADHPIVLVTSAAHMPRALNQFKLQGLNPYPAPTNYLAQKEINQPWIKYAPKAEYLKQTEIAWYEYLGQYWYSIKEFIAGNNASRTENKIVPLNDESE